MVRHRICAVVSSGRKFGALMLEDFRNYWLKLPKGYVRNTENNYYDDTTTKHDEIWQPEVYSLAQHLISRGDFDCIVDIGSGNGRKLAE